MRDKLKALIIKMKQEIADTGDLYYPDKTVGELEAAIRPQWVPVSERLPDHGVIVLVFDRHNDMFEACYQSQEQYWETFHRCGIERDDITHWHAIDYPLPPEVKP